MRNYCIYIRNYIIWVYFVILSCWRIRDLSCFVVGYLYFIWYSNNDTDLFADFLLNYIQLNCAKPRTEIAVGITVRGEREPQGKLTPSQSVEKKKPKAATVKSTGKKKAGSAKSVVEEPYVNPAPASQPVPSDDVRGSLIPAPVPFGESPLASNRSPVPPEADPVESLVPRNQLTDLPDEESAKKNGCKVCSPAWNHNIVLSKMYVLYYFIWKYPQFRQPKITNVVCSKTHPILCCPSILCIKISFLILLRTQTLMWATLNISI